MKITHVVTRNTVLRDYLRKELGISARLIQRLKWQGSMSCNEQHIRTIDKVCVGDLLELILEEQGSNLEPAPELVSKVHIIDIREHWVVINKPADMPIHPSATHWHDTLGNVWAAVFPNEVYRPVYRLDRTTSGLCLIARTPYAADLLSRSIRKTYYALLEGEIENLGTSGRVELPIKRAQEGVLLRITADDGEKAVTRWRVLRRYNGSALVGFRLYTGRTHQIRVHMASLNTPLVADHLYNPRANQIDGNFNSLHCGHLCFRWGDTFFKYCCELPDHFLDYK